MKSQIDIRQLFREIYTGIVYAIILTVVIAILLMIFVPLAKLLFNEVLFFWNLIP